MNYIKIIILIGSILVMQNSVFATELTNNKQQENEQKIENIINQNFEQIDKNTLFYILLLEDDWVRYSMDSKDSDTIWSDLIKIEENYQKTPNDINYKYAKKILNFYDELFSLALDIEEEYTKGATPNKQNIINKKKAFSKQLIIIPDNDFNKIDKKLLQYVFLLNIIAKNFIKI